MHEFYFIYYLVLFGIYSSLPVVFWLLSRLPRKEVSRVAYYKKELRGHLTVSLVLSAIMLSFVPWPIAAMQDAEGGDKVLNGLFVIVFLATAGFFIKMGMMQAGANRRSLREEQAKAQEEPDQK